MSGTVPHREVTRRTELACAQAKHDLDPIPSYYRDIVLSIPIEISDCGRARPTKVADRYSLGAWKEMVPAARGTATAKQARDKIVTVRSMASTPPQAWSNYRNSKKLFIRGHRHAPSRTEVALKPGPA